MNHLELKIPPPIVAAVFAALMWLTSRWVVSTQFTTGYSAALAVAVACIGLVFGTVGIAMFVSAKTTVDPMKPQTSSSLVTGGLYRFSRNPMYLSLVLYLAGWAVYLSNWLALAFLPAFVLYMNEFQIKPEERALADLFGAEYELYKSKVRRWL